MFVPKTGSRKPLLPYIKRASSAVLVQETNCGKLLILIMLTFSLVLAGCSKDQPSKKPVSNAAGQEIKIAVSLADMERDGNKIIKQTMSARRGGQQGQQKVSITWQDAKNDPVQQEKDLEQLASQNVKAVLLQLVDPASGPGLVRKLLQSGIKVIALETLPANCPVDGYISPDHTRTGELLANFTGGLARGSASPVRVVLLQGEQGDQAVREIASNVLNRLNNLPRVKVVSVQDHPRGDPGQAAVTIERVLATSNNQIDAVLATDSRLAVAAAEVIKNRGLDKKIVTAGVGADQLASRALVAGEHEAEVDLMPELMAQYAYDALVGLAATGYWQYDRQVKNGDFDVPARITPVRLITREDAYLLEQRWGPLTGQQEQQDQNRQDQQGQEGNQGGQNQQENRKTTLKITTIDGKTVEMEVEGEIKKIETTSNSAGKQGGGQGGGGQGGQAGGQTGG